MSIPAQPDPIEQKATNNSVGELLSEVSSDLSELMRQEVALAKAEVRDSAKKAGKGAGMLGGAALTGYLALLFLTIAVWIGIADLINSLGWAALIIAVIYAIIAAILAAMGKKKLEAVEGAPQTVDTAKEIPSALKPD